MTAIVTSHVDGDVIEPEDVNRPGLALAGLGIRDDNLGFPHSGHGGFGLPFSIRWGQVNELPKSVSNTTYTVPANKLFIARRVTLPAAAGTGTPSGGSALEWIENTQAGGGSLSVRVNCPFGAGDTCVSPGATTIVSGVVMDAPSDITRIFQSITAAASYTPAAGKRAIITHAWQTTAGGPLVVHGENHLPDALVLLIPTSSALTYGATLESFIPVTPAGSVATTGAGVWTVMGYEFSIS
jgi:hypothetical protein